jgi:outer membrane protein assembly factor BamA
MLLEPRHLKSKILLLWVTFSVSLSIGQVKDSLVKDSAKLPFKISEEERLSAEDLKNKKEGAYLTGVPDLSSDPVNGFGAGAEAQLFINGKRSDPFFAYTAYRAEIDLSAFYTTKQEREFQLVWDVPYIFNTKWRLRGQCEYMVNPNYLFFGSTEATLAPLTSDPENNNFYNTFQQEERSVNVSLEHSWLQSKLRTLIGYELAGDAIGTPLNTNSLLAQQVAQGLVRGFGIDHVALWQLGIIYDTRDLEPDPSGGVFAELTNEFSSPSLESEYSFNRTFFHFNYYHLLLPDVFKKLVFAGRIGLGYTSGNAPFYEYMDQWSSEGDVNGLGGPQTLRGYVQSRFVAPAMGLANIELRYRFWQTDFIKQHLAFYAIPFFDAGGIWNSLNRIGYLKNMRYAEGPGMQIAWNEDTILRFDYGISSEGTQFYFGIGQIF